MNELLNIFFVILLLGIFVFCISQFCSMIKSRKLNKKEKAIWVILFIGFSAITSIVWWVLKRK